MKRRHPNKSVFSSLYIHVKKYPRHPVTGSSEWECVEIQGWTLGGVQNEIDRLLGLPDYVAITSPFVDRRGYWIGKVARLKAKHAAL